MADSSDIAIRFSRRELALVAEAVEFMPLPENPEDEQIVTNLREFLTDQAGKAPCGKALGR